MLVKCGALSINGNIVYTLPYYPVGRIIETTNPKDNPNTLYKGQKWEYFGAGKVMVGYDPNDTDFNTIEKVGGEKEHKLTKSELPKIDIKTNFGTQIGGNGSGLIYGTATGNSLNYLVANDNFGDKPHNNLQPYIVVYRWRRIS